MQYSSPAHFVFSLHSSIASIGAAGCCGSLGWTIASVVGSLCVVPASLPGLGSVFCVVGCMTGVRTGLPDGCCCAGAARPAEPVFIGGGCSDVAGGASSH